MNRQDIVLNALCLLMVLVAIVVGGWLLVSGRAMREGVDGLFLLSMCLLMAAVFAPIPLQAIRRGDLRELLKARKKQPVVQPGAEPVGERDNQAAATMSPREPQEKS